MAALTLITLILANEGCLGDPAWIDLLIASRGQPRLPCTYFVLFNLSNECYLK